MQIPRVLDRWKGLEGEKGGVGAVWLVMQRCAGSGGGCIARLRLCAGLGLLARRISGERCKIDGSSVLGVGFIRQL